MITDFSQRWAEGTMSLATDEPFSPRDYEVAEIDFQTARTYVIKNHYLKSYPSCRERIGLFHRGKLCGVAVFSFPGHNNVLENVFPVPAFQSLELGRFVLDDFCPRNSESWFFARCREILKNKQKFHKKTSVEYSYQGIVSFSDDVRRYDIDGKIVAPGHCGFLYMASNGVYLGRGASGTIRLLPDGRSFHGRTKSKVRNKECGHLYATRLLMEFGATEPESDEAEHLKLWEKHWVEKLTRPLRHPGNHKYSWGLNPKMMKVLPKSKAYPKILYSDWQTSLNFGDVLMN